MPTMCIQNLKDRLGNYVRHCWGTVLMVSVDGDDGGDVGDGDGGDGGRRRRGRRGAELDCVGTGLAQTQTALTSKMNGAGAEA